jgi:hypothetical protein
MPGTRIFTLSLLLAAPLPAQTFWPLEAGNQWVYRSEGPGSPSTFVVAVERIQNVDGNIWALVTGLPSTPRIWLRNVEGDGVWSRDPETGTEKRFIHLDAAVGEPWTTAADECTAEGQVVSRAERYSGPLGEFDNVLRIRYSPGGCADAGLETDHFLPYVGLLSRVVLTIAGPWRYDLVYARLGTATLATAPEVSFTLAIDRAAYTANLMPPVHPRRAVPVLAARFAWRNSTAEAIPMEFPSGQTYEAVIRDSAGREVYRWSHGRAFTMAIRHERWGPGERNWSETIPLAVEDGTRPLPAGRYVIEVHLTTGGGKEYSASVPFDLLHVF